MDDYILWAFNVLWVVCVVGTAVLLVAAFVVGFITTRRQALEATPYVDARPDVLRPR
jgi:hypothetical protein